jgi:cell division protease FtsH
MQWVVDQEVRRIVDDLHDEVTELLGEHRDQLDSLTHALLKAETLDAPDAYSAAGVPMRAAELPPDPEVKPEAEVQPGRA